jgi:hypothetical protein
LETPGNPVVKQKSCGVEASQADSQEVTQKVKNKKKHSQRTGANQGCAADSPQPNKINTFTPFDFSGKNLTPYGGLLPVATLLEKIGFRALLEQTLKITRVTRVLESAARLGCLPKSKSIRDARP